MASVAKPQPQTRREHLREVPVDHSVRGTDEERAAHQLRVLEDWRPIREKAGK